MLLTPSKPPDLEPLRNSFANTEAEADLRQLAIDLFTENMRSSERQLNVYGMPHLGPFQLLERVVTGDGLALYRREDQEAMRYLFKAWKARNPKRGLIFLRTYLQLLWPNGWTCEQLWHLKTAPYPFGLVRRQDIPETDPNENHFLTSRVAVQIFSEEESGDGVLRVAPSLRAVVPARILLLISLSRAFENIGTRALGVSNGSTLVGMAFYEGEALLPEMRDTRVLDENGEPIMDEMNEVIQEG